MSRGVWQSLFLTLALALRVVRQAEVKKQVSGFRLDAVQTETILTAEDTIVRINQRIFQYEKPRRSFLIEGDIIKPLWKNAVVSETKTWQKSPDGMVRIPYEISQQYDEETWSSISRGFKDFEKFTCVRFIPHSDEEDYISIQPIHGCYSSVGRVGGMQLISLNHQCLKKGKGVVEHEIMHSLGFWHEHARSDRDKYIKIEWKNVWPGYEHNFLKQNTNNLKTKYDYGSILHYSRTAFSKNRQPTLRPLMDTDTVLGQRIRLSEMDLMKVNRLYNCTAHLKDKAAVVKHLQLLNDDGSLHELGRTKEAGGLKYLLGTYPETVKVRVHSAAQLDRGLCGNKSTGNQTMTATHGCFPRGTCSPTSWLTKLIPAVIRNFSIGAAVKELAAEASGNLAALSVLARGQKGKAETPFSTPTELSFAQSLTTNLGTTHSLLHMVSPLLNQQPTACSKACTRHLSAEPALHQQSQNSFGQIEQLPAAPHILKTDNQTHRSMFFQEDPLTTHHQGPQPTNWADLAGTQTVSVVHQSLTPVGFPPSAIHPKPFMILCQSCKHRNERLPILVPVFQTQITGHLKTMTPASQYKVSTVPPQLTIPGITVGVLPIGSGESTNVQIGMATQGKASALTLHTGLASHLKIDSLVRWGKAFEPCYPQATTIPPLAELLLTSAAPANALLAPAHSTDNLMTSIPTVENPLESTPYAEDLLESPPAGNSLLASTPPAHSLLASTPPADSLLVSTPPADSLLASTPPADSLLVSTPTADSLLVSTPPADSLLTSTPPADSLLVSTPTADSLLVSTPPAALLLVSTPPADSLLASTPPADSLLAFTPTADSLLASTPSADSLVGSTPPADCLLGSTPPADSLLASIPPADSLLVSTPPADSLLASTLPADSLLASTPPADSLLVSTPPADSLLACTPPEDSLLVSTPTADSLLASTPPADSLLVSTPPADSLLACTPPADSLLASAPPADTLLASIPPADTVLASTPPANSLPVSIPPADSLLVSIPPADSLLVYTPPADSLLAFTPPADSLLASIPPADSLLASTPPADSLLVSTLPADSLLVSTPPADSLLVSILPADSLMVSTLPADSLLVSTLLADFLLASTPPSDTLLVSSPPLDTLLSSTPPVDTPLASSVPTERLLASTPSADSLLASTLPADSLLVFTSSTDTVLVSTHPPDSLLVPILPADSLLVPILPADSLLDSLPPADTLLASFPPEDTLLVSLPPVDFLLVSTPPADSLLVSTSPADSLLVSSPSADSLLVSTPPEDNLLASPPPADTLLASTPPEGTLLGPTPPVDILLASPPPADSLLVSTPPVDTLLVSSPSVDSLLVSTPPADILLVPTFPGDILLASIPPADSLLVSTPPADSPPASTPPADILLTSTPLADTLLIPTPPADTLLIPTPPADTLLVSTPPADTLLVSTPPSDTLLVSTLPADTLLASIAPADTMLVSTPPANTLLVSTPPADNQLVSSSHEISSAADSQSVVSPFTLRRWHSRVVSNALSDGNLIFPSQTVSFDDHAMDLFCDFEHGLCDWEQSMTDDFDWMLHRHRTSSRGTGPRRDHTKGQCKGQGGHYLYLEASYPQQNGEKAVLISPPLRGQKCLIFWFNMFGKHMGTLNIFLKYENSPHWQKLWSVSGNQGRKWLNAKIDLTPDGEIYRVIVEGTLGLNYQSDAAIDDMQIHRNSCASGWERQKPSCNWRLKRKNKPHLA